MRLECRVKSAYVGAFMHILAACTALCGRVDRKPRKFDLLITLRANAILPILNSFVGRQDVTLFR